MAEEAKKQESPKDPNKYADYGAAMAPVKNNPMAVEWQKTDEVPLAAATTAPALDAHVRSAETAAALLAQIKGAYAGDPRTLTVIGAVSQHVMTDLPAKRKIWNAALLAAFRTAKGDVYVQTFVLDQLRWCGENADDVRALAAAATDAHVKEYIDWVAAELAGAFLPAK